MLTTVTAPKSSPRRRSVLSDVGEDARREAQRARLLAELKAHGWNLTATGEALNMHRVSVQRALKELDPAEYDRAVSDGRINPANRRE